MRVRNWNGRCCGLRGRCCAPNRGPATSSQADQPARTRSLGSRAPGQTCRRPGGPRSRTRERRSHNAGRRPRRRRAYRPAPSVPPPGRRADIGRGSGLLGAYRQSHPPHGQRVGHRPGLQVHVQAAVQMARGHRPLTGARQHLLRVSLAASAGPAADTSIRAMLVGPCGLHDARGRACRWSPIAASFTPFGAGQGR